MGKRYFRRILSLDGGAEALALDHAEQNRIARRLPGTPFNNARVRFSGLYYLQPGSEVAVQHRDSRVRHLRGYLPALETATSGPRGQRAGVFLSDL